MDSTDIYYSDNSQLIESNNTEWINNAVLLDNEDVTWHDDGPEITVDYSESAVNINQTLTENSCYESADGGDNSETSQYFSILESAENDVSTLQVSPNCVLNVEVEKEETILPDITAKTELQIEELNLDDKVSENEIILYRPEGSEDLYAVQIAQDEHGNLQKYKFQVRQNADGQFEAIPGTIEIETANEVNNSTEEDYEDNHSDLNKELEDCIEPPAEQKPNITTLLNPDLVNDEQEPSEFMAENDQNANSDLELNYIENRDYSPSEDLNSFEQDEDEEFQTVEGVHVTGDSDSDSPNEDDYIDSRQFVKTTMLVDDNSEEEYEIEELEEAFQDENLNDAYEKDTQIENLESEIRETHTPVLQHKSNINNLKVPAVEPEKYKRNVTIYKDDTNLSYLVIKRKEKENVQLNRPSKFNTINMRSILKCNNPSFNTYIYEKFKKPEKPQHTVPSIISNKESNSKLVTKPKDLKSISPVKSKSARQPRKQSLNPVERAGSEIIVQPLVYSVEENTSNDITLLMPSKRSRISTEVLQVSDESDPEFVLKPQIKKRKRGRPRKHRNSIKITILDSDEEAQSASNSIIEVPSDQEMIEETSDREKDLETYNLLSPEINLDGKQEQNFIEEEPHETNSDLKKIPDSNEDILTKKSEPTAETIKPAEKSVSSSKKNKCPLCPKTFPRLLTLKRHINMHSARKSLRSTQKLGPDLKPQIANTVKNKLNEKLHIKLSDSKKKARLYNCTKCKLVFLLESQYKRHQTVHISKKHSTGKAPAFNKNISPKKNIDKQYSSRYLRSDNKPFKEISQKITITHTHETRSLPKNNFKCEFCGQTFSTRSFLFNHRNAHKTFPCSNCNTTFTAKILLDDHLRKSCVKMPIKTIRPSIVRKLTSEKNFVKCDKCSRIFPNKRSLQIHHSVSHRNRSTTLGGKILLVSDISRKEKDLLKKQTAHGGVPMTAKMQRAFDKMKQKT